MEFAIANYGVLMLLFGEWNLGCS
jgi:hypothetical protein